MDHEDLVSFVATAMLGDSDPRPLSVPDAVLALHEWAKEGVDLPAGISAKALADEWNRQLS